MSASRSRSPEPHLSFEQQELFAAPEPYSLNIEQVAQLVGVADYQRPSRAVMQLIHKHGLPCIWLGPRRVRFRPTEVMDWLRQRNAAPPIKKSKKKGAKRD